MKWDPCWSAVGRLRRLARSSLSRFGNFSLRLLLEHSICSSRRETSSRPHFDGDHRLRLGADVSARCVLVFTPWPASLERASGKWPVSVSIFKEFNNEVPMCPDGSTGKHDWHSASRIRERGGAPTRFGRERFRDSHQRLAISVASEIALSLASLQLRETLREQSIRDPLTRLFNRRFWRNRSKENYNWLAARNSPSPFFSLTLITSRDSTTLRSPCRRHGPAVPC